MSGVSFELEGLEETIANLDFSVREVNDSSNEVLKEACEVVRNVININTPVGDGNSMGGHSKNNVTKFGIRTSGGYGGKSILVGYSSAVAWRMWFLEEGTYSKGNPKGIRPRKIVANSLTQSGDQATQVITSGIRDLIASI